MISVLCPTRGRPAAFRRSIDSLFVLATIPGAVEVLAAIDSDDTDSYTHGALAGVRVVHVAAERYGYARLSEYWNVLAKKAWGDWLLLWNDDARILTPGWDTVVEAERPAVLWAHTRGDDPAGNYFPVWPAAWSRVLGHVCPIPGPHADTYLQALGKHLGRIRRIPVEIQHDRPDYARPETADQTYREGRIPLGSHGMTPGWGGDTVNKVAREDAARIRAAGLL